MKTMIWLMLLLLPCLAKAACNVGSVEKVDGDALLIRHARSFRLGTDMLICNGDRYQTAANSVATLKLRDGSIITVGKGSDFAINDYHIYKDKPNNASFELFKGAFRSVTGFITKRPHRYEIKTAVATIGIRGTDFWGGFGLTENGLDVVMLDGHGVYVVDPEGNKVELDKPGLGTTVVAGQAPTTPKAWSAEKVEKAISTITP